MSYPKSTCLASLSHYFISQPLLSLSRSSPLYYHPPLSLPTFSFNNFSDKSSSFYRKKDCEFRSIIIPISLLRKENEVSEQMTMSNINNVGPFGDTTLTKVFVGGLAWETPKEAMREHFDKYGDILEAVIISDKLTGRSKGYGFVTFKDPEAAKKACEDATPVINGRRANCNLASLGARRPRSASTTPPPQHPHPHPHPQQGSNGPTRTTTPVPASHVQWYYPAATPASAYHHQHHHHQAVPLYGYSPAYNYIASNDISYNHKLSYTGGSYMNGHYSQVYPGQAMVGANTLMPMYPLYQIHQSQTMGLPTAHHIYPQSTAGPMTTVPAILSKPTSIAPNSGTIGCR